MKFTWCKHPKDLLVLNSNKVKSAAIVSVRHQHFGLSINIMQSIASIKQQDIVYAVRVSTASLRKAYIQKWAFAQSTGGTH
jgi:hypothetical protein